MPEIALVLAVVSVAYGNGANDNYKGVATLYGSDTTSYRVALTWATITTFAGSIAAVLLAWQIVLAFSGSGIVSDELTHDPRFLTAAGLGAGATVLVASLRGLPISTTHALLGSLIGAGLVASRGEIRVVSLGRGFLLPLLASPIVAVGSAWVLYPALRAARVALGVERRMCLCAGHAIEPIERAADGTAVLRSTGIRLTVQQEAACRERYLGSIIGFDAQRVLDGLHFLSAGLVSFARGMNDTPKIAALLLSARLAGVGAAFPVVAVAMAAGGILAARRVAETMSHRITSMNHGQAFTANFVTATWVLLASHFGLPVSTTHVSVGSIVGIGGATGRAQWRTLAQIGAAWITTLPLAAILACALYTLLGASF
jgi:PiT family inorganic phosphate transporter